MKNSTVPKIAVAFIFMLLIVSFGYSTSCGNHGKEGHKSGTHTDEKLDKTTKHSEQKQAPEVGKKTLANFYKAYLSIQKALAEDDLNVVKQSTAHLDKIAKEIKGEKKHGSFLVHLKESVAGMAEAEDIHVAREHFMHLSYLSITMLQHNKYAGNIKAFVYHCPMAFNNKGADWLQSAEGTKNPYYGKSMLACGSKIKTIHK